MMECPYTDRSLCAVDDLDPNALSALKDHFNDMVARMIQFIVDSLNNYFGGVGSKAFEDIYSTHVCGTSFILSPMMLIALAGLIAFFVLVYLAGVITRNKQYITLAKTEFYELLFLFPIIYLLLQVPCLPNPLSPVTIYEGALLYIHSSVSSTIMSLVPMVLSYGAIMAAQVDLSQSWLGMGPKATKPPITMYTQSIKMLFGNSAVFLTLGYVVIASFMYMFDLLTYGAVMYVLPFGLLLRFIPPTKRIGGGLIGLSLGLAIFLPLVFWMNYEMMKHYSLAYYVKTSSGYELTLSPFFSNIIDMVASLVFVSLVVFALILAGAPAALKSLIIKIGTKTGANKLFDRINQWLAKSGTSVAFFSRIFSLAYGAFGLGKRLTVALMYHVPLIITSLIVITFAITLNLVLPVITFMVVASGVRALSGLFGQEIDVSNLTRLV